MSAKNSQAGQSPSESSIPNHEHRSNMDQLLSMEIVATTTTTTTTTATTHQASSIQLNPTDMIADIQQQQQNNVTPRQNARPEEQHHHHQQQQQAFQQTQQQQSRQEQQRRLQQQQQRLQQELRRIQQQQQSLRQETQRERQRRQREREQQRLQEWLESQNLTYEQWIERQNQERAQQLQERAQRLQERYQREAERDRQQREEWEHELYLLRRSPGFDEGMDEILQERQLDQYQLETMTPQERQAIWEQEQLNELEANPVSRPHGMPMNDLERYAVYREEQLWIDELEQIMNIDDIEKWERLEQQHRTEELLIQKKQWEEIAFLHQQLQQPILYSL